MAEDESISEDGVATVFVDAKSEADDLSARRYRAIVEERLFARPRDPVKIDRYVILERVGRGGLGVVYAAYDPKLDRRVAVKLLQPSPGGSTSAEGEERLLREAQALAKLAHPNVIAVHDAGNFEDRVFMAMELVEGQDLRSWAKTPRSWREVRRVFTAAGRGLAAAHAAGLIHRDFKPSNVLLGNDGRVRVLDFGLAKLVTRDENPSTPSTGTYHASDEELTAAGTIMGTPAYMAPEQHEGADVGPAADQYAFCVALYEAFHGKRPFSGKDLDQLIEHKRTRQIEPGPRRVPAWLDRVILRGLDPDPERRYPSMEPLLAQLERDPARTALRWGGGTAVLGALGAVFLLGRNVDDECDVATARVEAVWSPSTRETIGSSFRATKVAYAETTWNTIEPQIDEYVHDWSERRERVCQAERGQATGAAQSEETLCLEQSFVAISELTALLQRTDEDIVENAPFAVQALPSLDSCTRVAGPSVRDTLDPARRSELDALVARGRVLRRAGKYEEAREVLEGARARVQAGSIHYAHARIVTLLGSVTDAMGKPAEAEALLWEAAGLAEKEGDDRVAAEALGELVFVIGFGRGRHDEALRVAQLARAKAERAGNDPVVVGDIENYRGVVLNDAGRYDEAEAAHQVAFQLRSERFGPKSLPVASSYNNRGNVALARGDQEAAVEFFRKAIDIYEGTLGEAHPNAVSPRGNMATVLLQTGKAEEAERELRRLLELLEQTVGREHPNVIISYNALGSALRRLERNEEALKIFEEGRALSGKVMGEQHPMTIGMLTNIGEALRALGRPDEAMEAQRQAIEGWKEAVGNDHPNLAYAYTSLGELQREKGEEDAARASFAEALRLREAALGKDHPLTVDTRAKLEGKAPED